jgi:hypothetical protein
MKLSSYSGLGLITVVLILQKWDYSGLGVFILGISLCIPEIVEKYKK